MFVVLTVTTLLGSLLALEARAWLPHVSRRLISQATKQLPKALSVDLRQRWAAEIEADLASFQDRPLSGFVFALRVRAKGGRDLAAELALQHAIAQDRPPLALEEEARDGGNLAVLALLKSNFDISLDLLLRLLESSLREVVARPPDARQALIDELGRALAHPLLRHALNRFDPDLRTEEGLKMALVLRDLRKEVEGWNDRG
jgi:hypothetical protein